MVLGNLLSPSPLLLCAHTPPPSFCSLESEGLTSILRQVQGPGKMERPSSQVESLGGWVNDCMLILNINGSLCRRAEPGANKRSFWPPCGSKRGPDYLPEAARGLGTATGGSGQAEAGFELHT